MPGRKELKDLEIRRRELVLRSTLNRLAIGVELQNVQAALRPAERMVSSVRAVRPWVLMLAPLAGIFAARRFRHNGSGFSKVLGVLNWIQPLLALGKLLKSSSSGATRENQPATTMPGPRF
jgi:hypothetical protein